MSYLCLSVLRTTWTRQGSGALHFHHTHPLIWVVVWQHWSQHCRQRWWPGASDTWQLWVSNVLKWSRKNALCATEVRVKGDDSHVPSATKCSNLGCHFQRCPDCWQLLGGSKLADAILMGEGKGRHAVVSRLSGHSNNSALLGLLCDYVFKLNYEAAFESKG